MFSFDVNLIVRLGKNQVVICGQFQDEELLCKLLERYIYFDDSGYRSGCWPSYLKLHSSTTCNVTVTHEKSAEDLVEP